LIKKVQKFPVISQRKEKKTLEKHCPRTASRKKGLFKISPKVSRNSREKIRAAKCSLDVHKIFNDFAEFTE
jgi:hypothetical protein